MWNMEYVSNMLGCVKLNSLEIFWFQIDFAYQYIFIEVSCLYYFHLKWSWFYLETEGVDIWDDTESSISTWASVALREAKFKTFFRIATLKNDIMKENFEKKNMIQFCERHTNERKEPRQNSEWRMKKYIHGSCFRVYSKWVLICSSHINLNAKFNDLSCFRLLTSL